MKTISSIMIFLLFAFSAIATDRASLPDKTKEELLSVFRLNEKMFDAYFHYDAKNIEVHAKELSKSIDGISDDKIKSLLTFSQSKLAEINTSNDREKNNNLYHLVSMALIHLLEKYDLGDEYNAYSCPMVKMKWVQNSKKIPEISNPYAPGMPHCGDQDSAY